MTSSLSFNVGMTTASSGGVSDGDGAVVFSRSLSATFLPSFRCRDGAGKMSGESFTKLYWLRDRAVRQTVRRLKPRAGNGERYRINEYGLG